MRSDSDNSLLTVENDGVDTFAHSHIRRTLARVFLALCVMAVGVGYLGNYVSFLPWSDFTLRFPGWGALFLIIPALYFSIRFSFNWFWVVCLLGGTLIILVSLDVTPVKTGLAIVGAVLIILIGLRILLNPLIKKWRRRQFRRRVNAAIREASVDGICYERTAGDNDFSVVFGERTVNLTGKTFDGCRVKAAFGSLRLDLTGAAIENGAVIEGACSFGNMEILLPDDVRAEVASTGFLSETRNKHRNPRGEAATVVIQVENAFGEVTVK